MATSSGSNPVTDALRAARGPGGEAAGTLSRQPETPASGRPEAGPLDLEDPSLYFNREVSWLDFNDRVLQLAEDREAWGALEDDYVKSGI